MIDDEAQLLQRLRERDERAFEEFVVLYQTRVFRLVLRFLKNPAEAEDVAQDVFVSAFRNIESFRGDAKLSTWLYMIATNLSKNRIRHLTRRHHAHTAPFEDALHLDEAASIQSQGERSSTQAAILLALESLGEEHKQVIILRDIEELSYEDIGHITGLGEGTVKSRLHRARAALAKALQLAGIR